MHSLLLPFEGKIRLIRPFLCVITAKLYCIRLDMMCAGCYSSSAFECTQSDYSLHYDKLYDSLLSSYQYCGQCFSNSVPNLP